MVSRLSQYLVVEHNGDVYPCDFYVRPDLKLGNIMTQSWEEMLFGAFMMRFLDEEEIEARKAAENTKLAGAGAN